MRRYVIGFVAGLILSVAGMLALQGLEQVTITVPDPAILTMQFPDGRWRVFCLNTCEAFVTWGVVDEVYSNSFNTQQEASNWWQGIRNSLP